MDKKDFKFRELYRKILLTLATEFSYSNDWQFVKICNQLINDENSYKLSKEILIAGLNEKDLNNFSDLVILSLMEYENSEIIHLIYSEDSGILEELTNDEKTICLVFEFCYNSVLRKILEPSYQNAESFIDDSADFGINDFIRLNTFILEKSEEEIEGYIKSLTTKGFFYESKEENTVYFTSRLERELEFLFEMENNLNTESADKDFHVYHDNLNNEKSCINLQEFFSHYGDGNITDINLLPINQQVKYIYKKLQKEPTYLYATEQMFDDFSLILNKHPNIELSDREKLESILKFSLLNKERKICLPPLLFVGPPGCGKTRLCKEISKIFGQKQAIFVSCGSGGGIQELCGSSPEYRNSSQGKILSSIWQASPGKNILNSLIILDEIDKPSYATSDPNFNLEPSLILLFEEENFTEFRDNFFPIKVNDFKPNFIATANKLDSIPEPIINRINIIHFRDYTKEEIKRIVIPELYSSFKKNLCVIDPTLSRKEIDIIYELSGGVTRKVKTGLIQYIGKIYTTKGKRKLTPKILNELLFITSSQEEKQIGFQM